MRDILQKSSIISVLCFLSGSLCALAMAPYNVWPVFMIGFGVLYWAIASAHNKKSAFLYGWLWAFGYFIFSLYWIGNALLVEGNPYQWAWPFAVCGLPAMLAFFNAFACLLSKRFFDLKQWHGYVAFVSTLSLFEYLRGHLFTGFPWNLYGYTWADMPIALIASFESVYFLTFITLFWMCIPGFWIVSKGTLSKRVLSTLILVSFSGSFYYTSQQLANSADIDYHDDVTVKIIQPNTPQHEKWQRDKMDKHFQTALDLSKANDNESGKTLILWPETTLSPVFLSAPFYRQQINDMLNEYSDGAILMTGALRYDGKNYYNSVINFDQSNSITNIYNKSHLVPFGEYIPFQEWIPLKPVVQFQGFEKGKGVQDFQIFDTLKYSALVCYEIVFPNKVISKNSQADFIINVTNDAWYGNSPGPHQHLVKARFRAIEERLTVLRAANTGISVIIDPYGRIFWKTKTFTQDVLQSKIPRKRHSRSPLNFFSFFLFPLLPISLIIMAVNKKCPFVSKN